MGIRSIVSSSSEFSIVESQAMKSGSSIFSGKTQQSRVCFIQNKSRDTYAEDIVTQKIIYYISLFSDEVKLSLNRLRQQGLVQDFKNKNALKGDMDEFMINLDDVDAEFIQVIIGILEYYELFKLSILLCNRYKLTDKIGLYMIQISSKYSNIHTFRYNLENLKSMRGHSNNAARF